MIEKIKTALSLIVIIICLPYLITFVVQGDFLNAPVREEAAETIDEDTELIILTTANEIPLQYEKEALKAQTVIARTNIAYAREHDEPEPEKISREDMREQLGAKDFQKYYELLLNCVQETAGETVTYEGDTVKLPYHYVSAGRTRDFTETGGTMPYLKAADCANDLRSEKFLKIEFMDIRQFRNKLRAAFPDTEFPEEDVQKMAAVSKRDSSSYVISAEIPGKKISGEEFRSAFSLNSPCFSIKETDGKVRIITKGYGQGYGMSQYGANEMAKEGSSYTQILEYFYSGVRIGD